eukprot:800586_1
MAEAAQKEKLGPSGFKSLVGKWIGECTGEYPTIKTFEYGEQIEIIDTKKPFLTYNSQTWMKGDKNKLMHSETGFIRFPSAKGVDFVISQCTGIQEISSGEITFTDKKDNNESKQENEVDQKQSFQVKLSSINIGRVSTSKEPKVVQIQRLYKYDCSNDTLSYEIWMST